MEAEAIRLRHALEIAELNLNISRNEASNLHARLKEEEAARVKKVRELMKDIQELEAYKPKPQSATPRDRLIVTADGPYQQGGVYDFGKHEIFTAPEVFIPSQCDAAIFPYLMSVRVEYSMECLEYTVYFNLGFYAGEPTRRPFVARLETGYVAVTIKRHEVEQAMDRRRYQNEEVQSLVLELATRVFEASAEGHLTQLIGRNLLGRVSESMVKRVREDPQSLLIDR